MSLMLLAIALQLPVQQPTRADVVIRVDSRYAARAETGGSLRIEPTQQTFIIDSTRTFDSTRRVFARSMQVDVDARGLATVIVEESRPGAPLPGDSATMRQIAQGQLLIGSSAGVSFPEERLARVFRQIPAARLRAGERWSEPVDWRGERYGVRAEERSVRTTVVLGDTLVDGRVHWLVRDSAVLQRQEEWPEHSYSLGADVAHRSETSGTRTSRWVYDPVRSISITRADTLRLDGTVTRSFPDGRTIDARHAITRYDASIALSPQRYDEVLAEQIAEARKSYSGGMRLVPTSAVEEGIAAGDPLVIDSLISAWKIADITSRLRIERQLMMWAGARAEVFRNLSAAALEVGDTASAFALTTHRLRIVRPWFEREALQFLLPYLEDERRALRNGLDTDVVFEAILNRLMSRPPVLAHDTANVCRDRGCELLEHYANRGDVDARLNDLAVIVRYYQDPRGGFTALEQRAASGTAMARRVYREALGYTREYSRPGEGGPLPDAGADWQVWAAWGDRDINRSVRVLKLNRLRTGRDFVREFRAGYNAAETDTTRFVFGSLLTLVDTAAFGTEEVVQLVTSPSSTLRRLGERALYQLFRDTRPASDEVAVPLLNDLIAMLSEGTPLPWHNVDHRQERPSRRNLVVITDSLPDAVQERWRDRITLISRAEWNSANPRLQRSAYTFRTMQAGPFVMLRYDIHGRLARSADEVPYRYMAGEEIVLLRTADGWRVVSRTGWAT